MAMLEIVETCDVQQKYLESEVRLKIPTDIKVNKGNESPAQNSWKRE
jgi:hypothetical protein